MRVPFWERGAEKSGPTLCQTRNATHIGFRLRKNRSILFGTQPKLTHEVNLRVLLMAFQLKIKVCS